MPRPKAGARNKRTFTPAEKVEIVEKILSGDLDPNNVKDSDGELIHYASIYTWISKYKAGELTKHNNKAKRYAPQPEPAAPKVDEKEILEIFKFMNTVIHEVLRLKTEVETLKSLLPADKIRAIQPDDESVESLSSKLASRLSKVKKGA